MLDFSALIYFVSKTSDFWSFSVCRQWTGLRTGTKPCSSRSTRFIKQVSLLQVQHTSVNLPVWCYFNGVFRSELARRAHVCICGWVCWFLLNQICWSSWKAELIRWGRAERSLQQMHVVLGNLLYFCWLDAEYKACLFIIALGSSATAHTFTSVCAWNVFLMDLTHDQYLQELYGNSFLFLSLQMTTILTHTVPRTPSSTTVSVSGKQSFQFVCRLISSACL